MGTVIGVVATSLVGVAMAVAASTGLAAVLGQDPKPPSVVQPEFPVYGKR
jgi:hypothetical protein